MNPLTAIPPKARLYVYALLTIAALGISAYKAAEGDWVEFSALLLGSLGFGTAASNTNTGGEHRADEPTDRPYTY